MRVTSEGAREFDAALGPDAVVVDLNGPSGLALREQALLEAEAARRVGGESGSLDQHATGKLAELVLRRLVPSARDPDDLGHDFILATGVRADSKCRGGEQPFLRAYHAPPQRHSREAKHNFYAGQIFGGDVTRGSRQSNADVYILSHLQRPKPNRGATVFPGTARQRKWFLHLCGWTSAARVQRGVYLPRGALTERGKSWFAYKGQEVEFYHRNLNAVWIDSGLLEPFSRLSGAEVSEDDARRGDRHITTTDYDRIIADLQGRGVVQGDLTQMSVAEPILSPNQYWHVADLLEQQGIAIKYDALEAYVGPRMVFGAQGSEPEAELADEN
jgi:hypothetical protein